MDLVRILQRKVKTEHLTVRTTDTFSLVRLTLHQRTCVGSR